MKIAMIIFRSLMGLMFLFASITYLFKLITPPPPVGAMKIFSEGLEASVYLMPTAKVIELICGIAFLTGRFVPLACILISPLLVNFILIHAFMAREGLPITLILGVANLVVAYYYREQFKPLFKFK